jgi:hypothetical protein
MPEFTVPNTLGSGKVGARQTSAKTALGKVLEDQGMTKHYGPVTTSLDLVCSRKEPENMRVVNNSVRAVPITTKGFLAEASVTRAFRDRAPRDGMVTGYFVEADVTKPFMGKLPRGANVTAYNAIA